jgi:hypothetical protein
MHTARLISILSVAWAVLSAAVWFILKWATGNFLYALFVSVLETNFGIREAAMIASISDILIPSIISACVIVLVYQMTKAHVLAANVLNSATSSLGYLSDRDSMLGYAIIRMAERSAWGRWFAAQHLVNSGSAIGEDYLLQTAGSIVMDSILDGDLEVRGRRPGRLDYEVISRTDWRSSGFHFVSDQISLWKMVIFPRGGCRNRS